MNAFKAIRNFIVILATGVLSVFILRGIALLHGYKIGDFDGFIYENIFSPMLGIIVAVVVLLGFRNKSDASKTYFKIVVISALILGAIHYTFYITGSVGGWYVSKDYSVSLSDVSVNELLMKSRSRNSGVADHAWREFLRRGAADNDILLGYLRDKKKKHPRGYVDDTNVRAVVKVLSENKNQNVIPFLHEMLTSRRYIKIVLRDNAVEHLYPSRKYAKRYLSEYFDEEHENIVVRQIASHGSQ